MSEKCLDSLKKTILVVEDDPASRALLSLALESEDLEVVTASGAAEALDFLQSEEPPSLVLLDVSMPGMNGDDFLKRLRETPGLKDLKIVLVSGWDDIAKRAQNSGASGYIRKPFDLRTLTREVHRHLVH